MTRFVGYPVVVVAMCWGCSTGGGASGGDPGTDVPADAPADEFPGDPPTVYEYGTPVLAASPWPSFRRTSRNDGRSPVVPGARGLAPWAFETGKGMFHAPVIGGDGTVYMGSADTRFYAIGPDGKEKWRFQAGDLIDSSALLGDDGTIYVPTGDGNLYALNPDGTERWRMAAPGSKGFITWWEGHVAMGPDGRLYLGNDDFHLYAVERSGSIAWGVETGDQVWSCPAFLADGRVVFGSNDLKLRVVDPGGKPLREWATLGPVTSSPAVSPDGKLVVFGSFDGHVYGVDPDAADAVWTVAARDHVYGSAAFAADGTAYVGSADGTLYAIASDGRVRWAFDTLDPIRSSPAVDGDGTVYFGAGDGRLYAIGADGRRRWSYDTTTSDRNDLNGSPALGPDGVYIGGESGAIRFVPFDFCPTHPEFAQCSLEPGEDLPAEGPRVYIVTTGGSSVDAPGGPVGPADTLAFRLVVRRGGDTVAARIDPASVDVVAEPAFAFETSFSPDGGSVDVVPKAPLSPGTAYRVDVSGDWLEGGERFGNKVTGGTKAGSFSRSVTFTTKAVAGESPLAAPANRASVLKMSRLAVPRPAMMATFNQIGFDSYNYLLSAIRYDAASGRGTLLAVTGTPGLDPGPDPAAATAFVLDAGTSGRLLVATTPGFAFDVSGVAIGFDSFRLAAVLDGEGSARECSVHAAVDCGEIEMYGALLDILGLCNPDTGQLVANGTAWLDPYAGPGASRPGGLTATLARVPAEGGAPAGIEATFGPNDLVAADHVVAVVFFGPGGDASVDLPATRKRADAAGKLAGVRAPLPEGATDVVVVVDLFPVLDAAVPP